MLAEVRDAEDRGHARDAAKAFDNELHAKWPKAAEGLRDDLEPLICFFDYPAEHWVHLKTSNPIESTSSTVRLRKKVTKGPGPLWDLATGGHNLTAGIGKVLVAWSHLVKPIAQARTSKGWSTFNYLCRPTTRRSSALPDWR
jgi:hypothetical protein